MKSRERPVMVVHGPEIFDTGYVYRLNNAIRPERIIVAGVMARTAAEESGIPVEYLGNSPVRSHPEHRRQHLSCKLRENAGVGEDFRGNHCGPARERGAHPGRMLR